MPFGTKIGDRIQNRAEFCSGLGKELFKLTISAYKGGALVIV